MVLLTSIEKYDKSLFGGPGGGVDTSQASTLHNNQFRAQFPSMLHLVGVTQVLFCWLVVELEELSLAAPVPSMHHVVGITHEMCLLFVQPEGRQALLDQHLPEM